MAKFASIVILLVMLIAVLGKNYHLKSQLNAEQENYNQAQAKIITLNNQIKDINSTYQKAIQEYKNKLENDRIFNQNLSNKIFRLQKQYQNTINQAREKRDEQIKQLEQRDPQVKSWSKQPLPNGVIELLQHDDGAANQDSNSTRP